MFIFAADIHLSKTTFRACPEVEYEGVQALSEILTLCEQYKCPLVLGGDTWDTYQISSELFQKVQALYAMHPTVQTYYINGNHDSVKPNWLSFLGDKFMALDNPEHPCIQLAHEEYLLGCDYVSPALLEEKLKQYESFRSYKPLYLLTHQYINLPDVYPSGVDPSVYEGFEHVLAGDIHRQLHFRNISYPGCASRRAMNEPRGAVLLCDGDNIKSIPLHNRRAGFITLPDTGVEDFIDSMNWTTDVQWESALQNEPVMDPTAWLFVTGTNLTNAQVLRLKKRLAVENLEFHVVPRNRTLEIDRPAEACELSGHNGLEYAVSAVKSYSEVPKTVRDITTQLFEDPNTFQQIYTY